MIDEELKTLKKNVREIKHGTVGVRFKIHNGKIVQTLHEITRTEIGKKEESDDITRETK